MKPNLTYRGYAAFIEFDAEDRVLVGRVVGIDDLITFHADSVAEVERAFHESIDDYILACEQLGQAPDKPASGKLMLRIDPAIHAAALKAAAAAGTSLNKWAESILRRSAHP